MAGSERLEPGPVPPGLNWRHGNHVRFRCAGLFVTPFVVPLDFEEALVLPRRFLGFELRFFEGFTRSGSLAPAVSRFHSSRGSSEISPFTSSSANLRRCALLLNGIVRSHPDAVQCKSSCTTYHISGCRRHRAAIPWNPRKAQHDSPYVSIITYAVRDLGRRCSPGRS